MSQTDAQDNKGIGRKVQAFGSFLSSMIMPNIGVSLLGALSRQYL
ncbi:mannitol-specific phosphotransferase system IIBC component [Staphylococcus cohnii]